MSLCRDRPLNTFSLMRTFDKLYHAEIRAGRVFTIFSVLAVFVACLGLLGTECLFG